MSNNRSLKHLSIDTISEVIKLAEKCYPNPWDGEVTAIRDSLKTCMDPDWDWIALSDKLRQLTDEELSELAALMWLGSGDGGWAWLIVHANRMRRIHFLNADYIAEKRLLAQYLRRGLRKLGR